MMKQSTQPKNIKVWCGLRRMRLQQAQQGIDVLVQPRMCVHNIAYQLAGHIINFAVAV